EIILRGGLRRGPVERNSRARLLDLVIVAGDLSRRANANAKLLHLLRLEEANVPKPNVQFRRHQPLVFLQPEFPLEIHLGVVVQVKNNCGLVAADVLTDAGDEIPRSCEGFFAGNLKIDGRFGKSAEEISLSKEDADASADNPQQQSPLAGTCQTVSRHMNLP